jgi:hypothetical protein
VSHCLQHPIFQINKVQENLLISQEKVAQLIQEKQRLATARELLQEKHYNLLLSMMDMKKKKLDGDQERFFWFLFQGSAVVSARWGSREVSFL